MAFQLSAGVLVVEKDLTTTVPAVPTSIGGFVGQFQWGPVLDVQDVSSELDLVRFYGKPNASTYASFFSAANFLGYANSLKLVRVVDTTARNAVSEGSALAINNQNVWEDLYSTDNADAYGPFAAKYPGAIGNSLRVSMADSATFDNTLTGLITTNTASPTVSGTGGTLFLTELHVGAKLYAGTTFIGTVLSIGGNTTATLTANALATFVTTIGLARWVFYDLFDSAPGTSVYCETFGGSVDELHIVVEDYDGLFTGTPGTILEKFVAVSKAGDAKTFDGASNYYKNVLATSEYVWWMDEPTSLINGTSNWGSDASENFAALLGCPLYNLSGGLDGGTPTNGNVQAGYDLFKDADLVDVNIIFMGHWPLANGKYVIENVAESRKDCVVTVSPSLVSVLNNAGSEAEDIVTERSAVAFNVNSSYGFMDGNWKYQYDKYNDVYRWIPLNPDTAGLMARTDNTNDPWWSPGGLTRGQIKNVTKLAWNPNQSQRDTLYKSGINPIVTKRGQGTVLWGDKTLLSKPSAFDRINVRRLFIVLEKSIAVAGETQLFEFNDAFTRSYFRNIVEPFLRDVKARRGVTDFMVVCDETNNTAQIIDRNEFIADIYIKPVRSINFITLNFVATRTGVSFTEVQGA